RAWKRKAAAKAETRARSFRGPGKRDRCSQEIAARKAQSAWPTARTDGIYRPRTCENIWETAQRGGAPTNGFHCSQRIGRRRKNGADGVSEKRVSRVRRTRCGSEAFGQGAYL